MGQVALMEDLLRLSRLSWETLLEDLQASAKAGPMGGLPEGGPNAGGVSLEALTLAAQLLRPSKVVVSHYGLTGDDLPASRLRWVLAQTPLDLSCFRQRQGITPARWVLNPPRSEEGAGAPCTVFQPGTVAFDPELLDESFFQATINLYAGTAMVPALQEALPRLLAKGRRRGIINIVGLAHPYPGEKAGAGQPWRFGGAGEEQAGDAVWADIDLLVGEEAEIIRHGGQASLQASMETLIGKGLAAVVATRGLEGAIYRSVGGIFGQCQGELAIPSALAGRARSLQGNLGDTLRAGGDFLGGLVASLFLQLLEDDFYPKGEVQVDRELLEMVPLRLRRAVEFANLAGGLAWLQNGGIGLEASQGEKLGQLRRLAQEISPPPQPW